MTQPQPNQQSNLLRPAASPPTGSSGQGGVIHSGTDPEALRGVSPDPRSTVLDRRAGIDRRDIPAARLQMKPVIIDAATDAPADADSTGLERRRGPGRRRSDFAKSAEEGEMNGEQFLFVMAIEAFKKANGKLFPTWTDVLEVIRLLGYRKTMKSELSLRNADDWLESANASAKVRRAEDLREAA
ncbi:MAG: hypothetical protein H7Y88_07675 [Phycisphaerales bacterium]|nr:hypothetical protein [Phycisphaerales bacterium]